jgi:putative transposase
LLVLARIGRIPVHWSRPIEGAPKSVTISKEAGGWYVSFSCAEAAVRPLTVSGRDAGIDLGTEAFATVADGARILRPLCYRKVERHIAERQRRLSRRKQGGHPSGKPVTLLAKAHQTVRRQRQDIHHKTALTLVREYDTIYHEDLRVASLARSHHLATSISGAGWSALLAILSFKAESQG